MYPRFDAEVAAAAAEHLSKHDSTLKPVIAKAGLADIKPHQDYYWELVDSIISQQLSLKAAAAIERRFLDLFGGKIPTPDQILSKQPEELKSVGLSRPKVGYIQDLARHVNNGKVVFDQLDSQSNQQIIDELTDVKGIGEWTVHMFLIFAMGRTDILPTGDLGIKKGIRDLYGLRSLPTPEEIRMIASDYKWKPYQSVACWYIWQSIDNST